MKKIICFILSLTFVAGAIFISTSAHKKAKAMNNKEESFESSNRYEIEDTSGIGDYDSSAYLAVSFEPTLIIDPETGCYGFDFYLLTRGIDVFSNFKAKVRVGGENAKDLKFSYKKDDNVKGTLTVNYVSSPASGDPYFNLAFNAPENVTAKNKIEAEIEKPDGGILIISPVYYQRVARVVTDKEAKTEIRDGQMCFDMSFYCITLGSVGPETGGETSKEDSVVGGMESEKGSDVYGYDNVVVSYQGDIGNEAGYMKDKKLEKFSEVSSGSFLGMLCGDYDFDGKITVRDLIAMQYYIVRDVQSFKTASEFGYPNYIVSSATAQYLQMYLAGKISYGEMFINTIMENGEM